MRNGFENAVAVYSVLEPRWSSPSQKPEGEPKPWEKSRGGSKPWIKTESSQAKPWKKAEDVSRPWKKTLSKSKPWRKNGADRQQSGFKKRVSFASHKK